MPSFLDLRGRLETVLSSGSRDLRRPIVGGDNESNIPGLFVIGDLAGAPVIKLAMAQGYGVIEHIAGLPEMSAKSEDPDLLDVLVVGAGASGLNAALAARDKGFSCTVLEKGVVANTIENFPEGKWVYAEPDQNPALGKLWLDGAQKEDLLSRWNTIVKDNDLDVRTEEPLLTIDGSDGAFVAKTEKGEYRARKIVLATGQRGNPRKLKAPGEDCEWVYHRLYSPRKYKDEEVLVVGGGNSAIEAALTLSEQNKVVLSYRKEEFSRIFKDNRSKLEEAVEAGRIEILFKSNVKAFGDRKTVLSLSDGSDRELKTDHAFVLIGAELPVKFLSSLGIRLENEWSGSALRALIASLLIFVGLWLYGGQAGDTLAALSSVPSWVGALLALGATATLIKTGLDGDRWSWLGLSFAVWYSIYGIKLGAGSEFWPFKDWGYEALSFAGRGWSFWYTVLYTVLMTFFGLQALRRWGISRNDTFQIWRFASLITFQWVFFFIIPEYLFQQAVEFQWLPETLATDPKFSDQAWRSYGVVYAWPLFFYTFFYDPHAVWVVWGTLLTFVVIPIAVIFFGKRYCSWICGCGGLAETFGDRWRHLAPKGKTSRNWEWMGIVVLLFASAVTLAKLLYDSWGLYSEPTERSLNLYRVLVDVWLVGILPVTLYPFLGGKVWCRYWCPLAKMMEKLSKLYAKLGISRFAITANDKCIGCNECSRNCQVGIDVMQYALKQEKLDNATSSCIGCGICVTVCPMDTLSFGEQPCPTAEPLANKA